MGIAKGDGVYKVLARKYRPTKLDEIIGQDVAVRILKNAILSNKLHHAVLLAGPMGTGKTSTARIIAKSLNCEKGPTIEPCNQCEFCMSISKGNSVDVMEIDGASNRKIDDARALIESVKYPPLKSRYKIYIIDEVHMLTQEAFNAMLKTIEEPPEYVKFIFATTAIEKVPDTILSRCQILNLKRIPEDLIKEKLKMIAKNENVSIDDEALDIIAFASFGSLRVAEGYLDRCISYSTEHLTQEDVSLVVGVTQTKTIETYFECIKNKELNCALNIIKELYKKDVNFEILMQQFIKYLIESNISEEYKAGLLNVYYHTFLDIKSKADPLISVNIATYKAIAMTNLSKISDVIEKIASGEIGGIDVEKSDILTHKYSKEKQYTNNIDKKEDSNAPSNKAKYETKTPSIDIESEIKGSKGLDVILKTFGGKIVSVEKINN